MCTLGIIFKRSDIFIFRVVFNGNRRGYLVSCVSHRLSSFAFWTNSNSNGLKPQVQWLKLLLQVSVMKSPGVTGPPSCHRSIIWIWLNKLHLTENKCAFDWLIWVWQKRSPFHSMCACVCLMKAKQKRNASR